jgi:D-beta-D-heptose 7-phosphate kinase / D-beta-D-heptose 1-phosphate adenosyltransferase
MDKALEVIRGFSRERVLVIGDVMLDSYFEGTATRLSPEGPVPVVKSQRKIFLPGGAANTAVNVKSLGADVDLLSVIGSDSTAELLKRAMFKRGVSVDHLIEDEKRCTSNKLRIMADSQYLARFDEEVVHDLDDETEEKFITRFRERFAVCDVVIISDYLKGVITSRFISELSELNSGQEKLVVLDSKDLRHRQFCNVSVITPNHIEAQKATNLKIKVRNGTPQPVQLERIGRELLEIVKTRWVLITLGADGALLFERDLPTYRTRAKEVDNPQVIGAGDTFTSALALALGGGADIRTAAEIATMAAGVAVSKKRTAAVSQQELLQKMRLAVSTGKVSRDLSKILDTYHRDGRTIVFTDGCFDILHKGHVAYLQEARSLGDVLIVGLNSDASVKRIKGPKQPLNTEQDRARVLAALECVDHVVPFEETTTEALIREIRPHIYVKSGHCSVDDLPEAATVREAGGRVVILPFLEQKSSTRIIERLRASSPS